LTRLLNFIEVAHKFSSDFNEQIYLRYCLWKNGNFLKTILNILNSSGFMQEMKQLPGLLKQEKESFYCILSINIKTYKLYRYVNYSQVQKYLDHFIEYI